MSIKEPDQSVWNRFWQRKNDMDKVYPSSPSIIEAIVYPSSPSIIEAIKKNFKLEGLKVLEVGAGTGRDSAELARLGADVYVLDFADNSLKIVNSLRESEGLKNLHLVRGDAFKSPFPDNTFIRAWPNISRIRSRSCKKTSASSSTAVAAFAMSRRRSTHTRLSSIF